MTKDVWARWRALLPVVALLGAASDTNAQAALDLPPGTRVRVTYFPEITAARAVGAWEPATADSVVLDLGSRRIAIPAISVTRVDTSHGQGSRSHIRPGMLIGGATGAALGAIAGTLLEQTGRDCPDTGACEVRSGIVSGAVTGALAGAVIGGVIGWLRPGEEWTTVWARPTVSVRPSNGGAWSVSLRLGTVPGSGS